jgi:Leucine-rich repeat (LRR) protein
MDMQNMWLRLIGGMWPVPRLVVSSRASHPMTFGLVRPTIVIPAEMCRSAGRERLLMVLRHELVHAERRDALRWTFANLGRVVLFCQPLYWWVRRQLRLSQEYVADVWAARRGPSVAGYAEALLDMAREQHPRPARLWQGISLMESHSDVYKRIELLSRMHAGVEKWCPRWWSLAVAIVAAVLVVLVSQFSLRAEAQRDSAENRGTADAQSTDRETDAQTSRIWYILRQPNTMGLFHGLPQRMEPLVTASEQVGEIWEGVADGGSLRLRIDSEVEGDIFVGFFADPRWWLAPPVQVRKFPGAGEYTVTGLPAGQYYLGAILGSLADVEGLGTERNWPTPVAVGDGTAAKAHVLVSQDFTWSNLVRNPRDFVGDGPDLDLSRLVTVRTVDADGNAVPYCRVTIAKRDAERTFDFIEAGTDNEGFAYRDDVDRTFSVTAQYHSFDPATLASRYQTIKLPEIYDPHDRPVVLIEWEPFPSGTGKVSGRVHDQHGRPLTEFHLSIRMDVGERLGWGLHKSFGMKFPVTDADGDFEVQGLAPGTYTITASAFDVATHEYQSLEQQATFTIPDELNAEVHVDVEIEARELAYGRAVFEDGTPVKRGGWISGNRAIHFAEDGSFRVTLSKRELDDVKAHFEGKIEVYTSTQEKGDRTVVQVPWDLLSKEPGQPYIVVFKLPVAAATEQIDGDRASTPDDPAAVLRLKQIGAMVQTRDDGTVRRISFLDARFDDEELAHLKGVPTLEELSIHRTGITDKALRHIEALSRLAVLDLSGEPITDTGFEQVKGLTNLRSINLWRTRISDKSLATLAALPHLEELDLSGTFISNDGLALLADHKSLKRLSVNDTAVGDDGLVHVARLKQLEELSLFGLRITDKGLQHLQGLTELTDLDLTNSLVTDQGLAHLAAMKNLSSLRLHGASITDDGVERLIQFSHLATLHLSQTQVTDAGLERLAALKELQTLYIHPHVTDAGLVYLAKCESLRVLGISDNRITDAGLVHVGKLTGLTNLFLDNTPITDAGLAHLSDLKELLFLGLQGTKVTKAGVSQAWEQHPRLQQLFAPE